MKQSLNAGFLIQNEGKCCCEHNDNKNSVSIAKSLLIIKNKPTQRIYFVKRHKSCCNEVEVDSN
jgi:hypothetical protein